MIFLLTAFSIASSRGNANPGIVPPESRVQGLKYGDWATRWWQYVLSIPTPENPLAGGTGNNCVFQQIGNIGLVAVNPTLGETIHCEVPNGMLLYLDILSTECSTLETPPFYGGNEAELRVCASAFTITDIQASIDGVEVKDLDQYIHLSPLFKFTLPEDNILGSDVLTGESVSKSAALILSPLSPGAHTIHLHASVPEVEYSVDMNFALTVVR